MEWMERLNRSVDYLEDHLEEQIDVEQAARIACCSVYHYQRMFSYIAGVSLGEYIRRRRMTRAAVSLLGSDVRIIDLALTFGYESPTAFSRAFQSVHGVAPSQVRRQGVRLKSFPRMTFLISIQGDVEMNFRIETKEAFRIVGVREHMLLDVQENFARVPQFWAETVHSGRFGAIAGLNNCPPEGVLGVSTCMNGVDFDYFIATATDLPVASDMEEFLVPEATWAVFECIGPMPGAIQELQKQIISQWLPASGFEYADAPDIEVYPQGDPTDPAYRSEVWLPVRAIQNAKR